MEIVGIVLTELKSLGDKIYFYAESGELQYCYSNIPIHNNIGYFSSYRNFREVAGFLHVKTLEGSDMHKYLMARELLK